jgi:pSer/pThr/pTyr-binding forkhead associated (FHA) protein
MGNKIKKVIERLKSKTYIIGREGQIHIDDPAVSKQHTELQIINGEIFMRGFGSTNSIFLIENQRTSADSSKLRTNKSVDRAWR